MSLKHIISFSFSILLLFNSCGVKETSNMPPFKILLADSMTVINSSDIPKGQPVVVIFFSPDCEHCQQETEGLIKHMDDLQNVKFYFVTEDPFDRIKVFTKYYKIDRYSNIIVGRDYEFDFLKYFDINTTPVTILYSKQKHLKMYFKGSFPLNRLIAAIINL